MNNNPLISIITPCYNAAPFLNCAIDSVLAQKYQNFELIIVDDGSTDDTSKIVKSYKDKRINYYKRENKGQSSASNFGLSCARGEFIKFFDADDVMNDLHLEAQVNRIQESKNFLVSCKWGRFYTGDIERAQFIPESVWKDMSSLHWVKEALSQRYDMMGVWLWLIPRSVIEKVGGWDERLSLNNDFEFSMRLLLNVEDVLFASDAKLYYRSGTISMSAAKSEFAYRFALLSTDLGCSYLLKREDSLFTRKLCADRYQEWLFRIFPEYPEIQIELNNRIVELGGSSRKIDGGLFFKLLCKVIGWRSAKVLLIKLRSVGYVKLPWN